MIFIVPAPTSGPDWASRWTAIGTVALAAVTVLAVLVTIFITRQDRRRADAQRREDREHAQQAVQEAEAWSVEVIPHVWSGPHATATKRLSVDVINLGNYTITRVVAQFSPEGTSLISYESAERMIEGSSGPVPFTDDRTVGFMMSGYEGILTRGSGLNFRSDPIPEGNLAGPYPVVRWHDRWGTCWEHKKGHVRKVDESEPWSP